MKIWTPDQRQNKSALTNLLRPMPHNSVSHPAYFNFDHIYAADISKCRHWDWHSIVHKQALWRNQLDHNSKTILQPWVENYFATDEVSADTYGEYFTEKPLRSVMWHVTSKANKVVHLSPWKFSLGPAPCFFHLFGRFIYLWLIWPFKGGSPTAGPDQTMSVRPARSILSLEKWETFNTCYTCTNVVSI